jgi:hypothetical protein
VDVASTPVRLADARLVVFHAGTTPTQPRSRTASGPSTSWDSVPWHRGHCLRFPRASAGTAPSHAMVTKAQWLASPWRCDAEPPLFLQCRCRPAPRSNGAAANGEAAADSWLRHGSAKLIYLGPV